MTGSSSTRQIRNRPWARKEVVLEAAERLRTVLVPVLGPSLGSERANNIAQALFFDASSAEEVAHEMLREVPAGLRRVVARQVSSAWSDGDPWKDGS